MSDIQSFIELAKDPKGFEAKLNQLKAAQAAHDAAATRAQEAEEKAAQERARANATIDEANAIMAGAKKGQAALDTEKEMLAEAKRNLLQITRDKTDEMGKRAAALEEREKAAERREVALTARAEKLAKGETEVLALKADLEAKLANLRKMVA
jgi:uncharacterized protein involved in exopolysaccharide biosynthesis